MADTVNIAFIEMHDAEVTRVEVRGAELSLTFGHILIYEPVSEDRFLVWAYEGELTARNARDIDLRLVSGLPADVVDLELDGSYPGTAEARQLLSGKAAQLLEFTLNDASVGRCACSTCQFIVGKRLRQLDDWVGPL